MSSEQQTQTFSKSKLKVSLPIWNGPLDLLLDLIKSAEINIYDIPIKEITSQYLTTIKLMQKLDIEVSSEFLVMASNLIYIKSKTMLPNEMADSDDENFLQNPHRNLVEQLLEYQKFKQLAEVLEHQEIHSNRLLERKNNQMTFSTVSAKDAPWQDVTLFELIKVFSGIVDIIDEVEIDSIDSVREDVVPVEDKIRFIGDLLEKEAKVNFYDLFHKKSTKIEIIVTFWAILEMYKHNQLIIKQHAFFGDIFIFKKLLNYSKRTR